MQNVSRAIEVVNLDEPRWTSRSSKTIVFRMQNVSRAIEVVNLDEPRELQKPLFSQCKTYRGPSRLWTSMNLESFKSHCFYNTKHIEGHRGCEPRWTLTASEPSVLQNQMYRGPSRSWTSTKLEGLKEEMVRQYKTYRGPCWGVNACRLPLRIDNVRL